MKQLIAITNSTEVFSDFEEWMTEINSVLKSRNGRVVNVSCADDTYEDATAWIEIDDTPLDIPLNKD